MNSKKAIVLGRGKSLSIIENINPEDFDLCVIINNFSQEYRASKKVKDFINKSKNIEQYIGRETQSTMKESEYKEMNVKKVILNILENEYMANFPYKGQSHNKLFLNSKNIKNEYLSDKILNHSEKRDKNELRLPGFPTTGILAITDLISVRKYTDITIVGVDFYESDYFCKHTITGKSKPPPNLVKKGTRMKNFLNKKIEYFKNTKFKIYTMSTF